MYACTYNMGFFGEPVLNRHYMIAFCEKFFSFGKSNKHGSEMKTGDKDLFTIIYTEMLSNNNF